MKVTNFYETDSHQMRHCDQCDMPNALDAAGDHASYSLVKHAIIETRSCWDDPEALEYMRAKHEGYGTLEVFEAALKCIRCSEGMCLILDGTDTQWRVGGNFAVGE